MSFTAAAHRHLRTLWKHPTIAWHWTTLNYGHAQAHGVTRRWCYRSARRLWQLHWTPIHVARDGAKWTYGLCLGRRTVYVMRHR